MIFGVFLGVVAAIVGVSALLAFLSFSGALSENLITGAAIGASELGSLSVGALAVSGLLLIGLLALAWSRVNSYKK